MFYCVFCKICWAKPYTTFVKVVEGQLNYNFDIGHLAYLCFKILSKTQLKCSKSKFQPPIGTLQRRVRAACARHARQRRGLRAVGPARTSRSHGNHAASAGALGGASTTFLTHPARATRSRRRAGHPMPTPPYRPHVAAVLHPYRGPGNVLTCVHRLSSSRRL
jgi:hypothetical protein